MNRRIQKRIAGFFALVVLAGAMGGAMLLQAEAQSPGPPTYIPPDPPGEDGGWGPAEGESGQEPAGESGGGTTTPPQPAGQSGPTPSQGSSSSQPDPAASTSSQSSQTASESSLSSKETQSETSAPAASGKLVTAFAELKSALSGTESVVSLGADIVMEESITLPQGRSVTIEGGGFQISEGEAGRTILAGDKSSVTVRNVTILGRDIMGFVGAKDGTDKVITFDSVVYKGPQLCQNAAGGDSRIVIKDCEVTLSASGATVSEELAQGSWIEFLGNTSVNQQSARHPTFHLQYAGKKEEEYGGCDRGVIVREGARVSIEAADYMAFGSGGAFVVEEGGYFRYTAPDGGTHGTENGFAWFDVGPGATFSFEQSGSNGHNKNRDLTIAAGGVFQLGRDSIFEVVTNDTVDSSAALAFRGDCDVLISRPKRVLIAGSGQAISVGDPKPKIEVKGINAFNYWDGAGGRYIWNDHTDGLTSFSFEVEADGGVAGVPETVKDMWGMPLSQSPVKLFGSEMQQLVLGTFCGPLAVESWEGEITGFAAAGAELTAAYYTAQGKELSAVKTSVQGADENSENSAYKVALPVGEAPAGTQLGVVATQDGLSVQRSSAVERVEGGGAVSAGAMSIWYNPIEMKEGRVETSFTVTDEAARGWRMVASDPQGGELARLQTSYSAGEMNAVRESELTGEDTLVAEIETGKRESSFQLEVLLPAKADGSFSPKTIRWTMILPVD